MAVSVVEHVSGTAGGFSTTYAVTLASTPTAGDYIIARFTQVRSGVKGTSVSGCGATWTKIANSADTDESVQVWRGAGASTSGAVTATFDGSTWATGAITLVRGLAATTVSSAQDTNNDTGSDLGPSLTAGVGQFVVASAHSAHLTAFSGTTPASGWTSDTVVTAATGITSGQSYRIPSAAGTAHQGTATNSNSTNGRHILVVIGDETSPVVEPPAATATAQFEVPSIEYGYAVSPPAATATATAHAPTVGAASGTSRPSARGIPLAVRVGDKHITREVSALQFRKEAVGGLKSISLRLARPLDRFDANLTALSRVYLYDSRSAAVVGEGRLADFGRSASTDGQQWDMVAFGPAQHAADRAFPYMVVDTSLERFIRSTYSTRNASTQAGDIDEDTPTLEYAAEEGKTISTTWVASMIHRGFREAGMKLARIRASIDAGVSDSDYRQQVFTRVGAGAGTNAKDVAASTGASSFAAVVVTDFSVGDDVAELRARRENTGTTGAEAHWFRFYSVALRAVLQTAAGADITTGYTVNYVLAHQVVNDLLGRVLDQFDGAGATVDTGAAHHIDQLAYPDGVTAEQVLADLMALEPAYRWFALPDSTGNGYEFHWEPWSTTVRYEVTLDDGGDFPASTQELYNKVIVRWRGPNGQSRTTTRTLACAILDDRGIVRSTIIDAGDEIASVAGAQRLGDNFLAEHNVPANAGSLTISRPIRDLTTGRMVDPHEIEPGELIRVRGIESYPDALNASSNDGLTVFRIWATTYSSDSHSAALELDTWSRTTANHLRALAKRRNRKR